MQIIYFVKFEEEMSTREETYHFCIERWRRIAVITFSNTPSSDALFSQRSDLTRKFQVASCAQFSLYDYFKPMVRFKLHLLNFEISKSLNT